jgi:hypothetical protein
MADGVYALSRAIDRGAVAYVAIDQAAGQAAATRRTREHDRIVSLASERVNDCPADVAGATCHEHLHGVERKNRHGVRAGLLIP